MQVVPEEERLRTPYSCGKYLYTKILTCTKFWNQSVNNFESYRFDFRVPCPPTVSCPKFYFRFWYWSVKIFRKIDMVPSKIHIHKKAQRGMNLIMRSSDDKLIQFRWITCGFSIGVCRGNSWVPVLPLQLALWTRSKPMVEMTTFKDSLLSFERIRQTAPE